MNIDLLDESYPMVKSKLPFEDFDKGGLTGYAIPVKPACRELPILGVNICPPVLWKSLHARNIHNDQNWLNTMINTTSPM
jgi:hypothetical protein